MKENKLYIVLVSCVATIGGFLFGFDSGVINGTVDGLQAAFNSDSVGTGFNVASMLLGCAAGAFAAGRLADAYGRKKILVVTAVLFIISAWGSGIATSSIEFIIYRVIGGFAVGAASILAPLYISEIAPAKYRGTLSSIQQVAIITGLTAAFVSNYVLAETAGSSTTMLWMNFEAWRWMFWIELFPAFLFLFALIGIPESPRYLVMKQDKFAATKVLTKLFGAEGATAKVEEIDNSLASDHHQPKFKDLIDKVSGKIRPIVWVGIGIAAFQQLVGINVVFYYGAVLWQAVGFSESDALMINIITGVVSIAACFVAMATIDKIGRKPLLMIGSIGMAVSLSLMVFAFVNSGMDADGNLIMGDYGTMALIGLNVYVFFFNISWGPVMWVMLGEMFPNQIRGSSLAVCGFVQWGSNFAVTMTFPLLLAGAGLGITYSIYVAFAVLSVPFVYKLIHETKGVELEQMEG